MSIGVTYPSAASTVVGVIGHPIGHSLSPLLHNTAFAAMGLDWVSVAFPVLPGAAAAALSGMRSLGIAGLSVTMPHKEAVVALVDRRTEVADVLGAVNCILRDGERLVGDNTDGEGFLSSLRRGAGFEPDGARCLVAGAGGAARAVVYALARAGAAEVVVVNRTASKAATVAQLAGGRGRVGVAAEAAHADLVVDATPTGMAGTGAAREQALVDPALLGAGQVAADLVYHPPITPWLAAAAAQGATIVGGLGMLVHQAAAALSRWTAAEPPVAAMWAAAASASQPLPGERGGAPGTRP